MAILHLHVLHLLASLTLAFSLPSSSATRSLPISTITSSPLLSQSTPTPTCTSPIPGDYDPYFRELLQYIVTEPDSYTPYLWSSNISKYIHSPTVVVLLPYWRELGGAKVEITGMDASSEDTFSKADLFVPMTRIWRDCLIEEGRLGDVVVGTKMVLMLSFPINNGLPYG